jgi:diguanylate cyclase (GGDEF)-like protein
VGERDQRHPQTNPGAERETQRDIDFEEASQIPTGEGPPVAIAQADRRPRLIALTGNAVGEVFIIEEGTTTVGRSSAATIHVDDPNSSRNHCLVVRTGETITIKDLGSTNGTFVNGDRLKPECVLRDGDKVQVGSATIFKFSLQDQVEEEAHRQLYESALLDGLTGCYNKKYFLGRLDSEVAYALRHQTLVSLLLFDIDHFKKVNDGFGHPAGDEVLSTVAALVDAAVRTEDVFARYGGEEFAIICRGIDIDGAVAFGERIRTRVQGRDFSHHGHSIKITISVGVSELSATRAHNGEQLLEVTDRALYRAKSGGRNRVVIGSK